MTAFYFPSESKYNIPLLLPNKQLLAPVQPIMAWGSRSRNKINQGMYHFYVDDYRFKNLIKNPLKLVDTGCNKATELNITVSLDTPKALVLNTIFWKRQVNRTWQQYGINTTVDVNIPTEFSELCFIGVPKEWSSFSTRGYSQRLDNLVSEYEMCREYSEASNIIFMVIGGGQGAKQLCEDNASKGWIYIADHQESRQGHFKELKLAKQTIENE